MLTHRPGASLRIRPTLPSVPSIDDPHSATTSEALRVGLVGAGPWAQFVHAPTLAAHPGVELTGVWARRADAADALALANGTVACASRDQLYDRCDAVVFAVPPDVQAVMAVEAAQAAKTVLLEKPLALDLAAAEDLVRAVDEAGVGSQVVLTWRYTEAARRLVAGAASLTPLGGRGWFVSGSALGGPFATPWRLDHGMLLDLGPHVIDLLDATLGPVVRVRASGDPRRWVSLVLDHERGPTSSVSISGSSPIEPSMSGIEVFHTDGIERFDAGADTGPDTFVTVIDEFIETARGAAHPLDAHRGLHLQRLIAQAQDDLG